MSQETSSSSFNWDDYLTFAEELVKNITGEASFRVATSRAYYAVYWKARELLQDGRINVPKCNTHKFVWDAFSATRDNDGSFIGKLGRHLKAYREKADYESYPRMTKADAEMAIIEANDLFQSLDEISARKFELVIKRAGDMLNDPIFHCGNNNRI